MQTALPSVKNRALGKELHSAKSSLPSAGHSAKKGTRHRLPRVTVFGHVLLCRVPAIRHSAKIFFFENTLPSAPDTALGKDPFFFEISLPSAPVKALGKEEFFLKKTFFIECLTPGTRQRRMWPNTVTRGSLCRVPRFCREPGTRQRSPLSRVFFCRVTGLFAECNSLPSARFLTLGKAVRTRQRPGFQQ